MLQDELFRTIAEEEARLASVGRIRSAAGEEGGASESERSAGQFGNDSDVSDFSLGADDADGDNGIAGEEVQSYAFLPADQRSQAGAVPGDSTAASAHGQPAAAAPAAASRAEQQSAGAGSATAPARRGTASVSASVVSEADETAALRAQVARLEQELTIARERAMLNKQTYHKEVAVRESQCMEYCRQIDELTYPPIAPPCGAHDPMRTSPVLDQTPLRS